MHLDSPWLSRGQEQRLSEQDLLTRDSPGTPLGQACGHADLASRSVCTPGHRPVPFHGASTRPRLLRTVPYSCAVRHFVPGVSLLNERLLTVATHLPGGSGDLPPCAASFCCVPVQCRSRDSDKGTNASPRAAQLRGCAMRAGQGGRPPPPVLWPAGWVFSLSPVFRCVA